MEVNSEDSQLYFSPKTQPHICNIRKRLSEVTIMQTCFSLSSCLQSLWYFIFLYLNDTLEMSNGITVIVKPKKQNIHLFNPVISCTNHHFGSIFFPCVFPFFFQKKILM